MAAAEAANAMEFIADKDAIKCKPFAQEGWWTVPVRAELVSEFFEAVAARVAALQGYPAPANDGRHRP